MTAVPLDPYIVQSLMRDLVGHDRKPSAFLVYLCLWHGTHGSDRPRLGISLQALADRTGLSKSSVQNALRHLARRHLITAERAGPTETPSYTVHQPWRRAGQASPPSG